MAKEPNRWSQLPEELIGFILQCLSFTDHIRFGAVCVAWRLIVTEKIYPPHIQVPWLMLPSNYYGNNSKNVLEPHCNILSLTEKKIYKLILPKAPRRRHVGSSNGWIVTTGISKSNTFDIHLFNIFSMVEILLPPLTPDTFADIAAIRRSKDGITHEYIVYAGDDHGYICTLKKMCVFFVIKAILYSKSTDAPSTSDDQDLYVILIYGENAKLAFCNVRDKLWTIFDYNRDCNVYNDVIFYNDRFYAVSGLGGVVTGDHTTTSLTVISATLAYEDYSPRRYLVEVSGDLLQILRFRTDNVKPFKTYYFMVFKLDPNGSNWVEVKSLPDCALFLGGNCSLCVSVRDIPECKGNCIYFTPDNDGYGTDGLDFGIFNLEDEIIMPYSCDVQALFPYPIWVTPPNY